MNEMKRFISQLLTFQGFIKLIIIEFSVEKFTLDLACIYKLLFKLKYIIQI